MNDWKKGDIQINLDYGTWFFDDDAVDLGTKNREDIILGHVSYNTLYAGAGNDRISISGGNNNIVYAENGDDFIGNRFTRNPTIYGGKGNDTIRIMSDNTYAEGGDDDDLFIPLDSSKGVTLNGDNGNDTFWFIESTNVTASGGDGKNTYRFDPYYLFGPYVNNVVITDLSGDDTIRNDVDESDGSELIISSKGKDIILRDSESGYGNFNITIAGGVDEAEEIAEVTYRAISRQATLKELFPEFFDELISDTDDDDSDDDESDDDDSDVIISDDGKSVTLTEEFSDKIFEAEEYGSGIITVDGSAVSYGVKIYGNSKSNKIIGGTGKDTLYGGKSGDNLNGGAGNDKLFGEAGKDNIYGGKGNDYIDGGASNDKLFGDAGNDTLKGGKGKDTLTGGSGHDVFVYASGDGKDVIADYKPGQDEIKITKGSIKKTTYKNDDVIFTIGNGTLTVKNGRYKKITINGNTKKYSNASSSADSMWFAEENNFVTSDNLSTIVENNLSAVSEVENQNFETLNKENFITFS